MKNELRHHLARCAFDVPLAYVCFRLGSRSLICTSRCASKYVPKDNRREIRGESEMNECQHEIFNY